MYIMEINNLYICAAVFTVIIFLSCRNHTPPDGNDQEYNVTPVDWLRRSIIDAPYRRPMQYYAA